MKLVKVTTVCCKLKGRRPLWRSKGEQASVGKRALIDELKQRKDVKQEVWRKERRTPSKVQERERVEKSWG